MANIKYEFLMSQIRHIRDITETEKTKISLVFYEQLQAPCILKICKNRDLSGVYQILTEQKHPNIAVVYDYVYQEPDTYVLEEFLTGRTLSELLKEQGTFTEKETAQIIIEVCQGLEILHSHKPPLVHNDIKTSNIMVREDGSVKLFDFDVARIYKAGAGRNTRLFGTEEYASPEHYGFGQSEPSSDVYTLGVTMHEMLTGQGLTDERKMTYTGKLKKIIQKCIAVDREKRYQNAAQLRRDLEKYLNRIRRMIRAAILCLCGAALLVMGGLLLTNAGGLKGIPGKNNGFASAQGRLVGATGIGVADVPGLPGTSRNDDTGNDQPGQSDTVRSGLLGQIATIGNTLAGQPGTKDGSSSGQSGSAGSGSSGQSGTTGSGSSGQGSQTGGQGTNSTTPAASTKKMVSYRPEGSVCTIEALPDGTFIWLEIISDKYHIKTSSGGDQLLSEVSGSYGARLSYDRYSKKLYLFEYSGKRAMIYEVDSNFGLKKVATFIDSLFHDDEGDLVCSFFSDGMMICNALAFKLIDSSTWAVVGKVPGAVYVINDRMYQRGHNRSAFFQEVDAQENVLNEYAEDGFSATVWESQVYQDGRYAYFIATEESREYVYRFDGERYEKIACLNDYKYYASFNYNYLCVTENAIRCYDTEQKVMKEFALK